MNYKATKDSTYLAMVLLLGVIATITLAENPELVQWQTIMKSRDKGVVFDALDASIPTWPKVHSSEFSSRMNDTDRREQTEFLSIAHNIVHDAKAFLDETRTHTSIENWETLNSAFELRDRLLQNPGYANLVLADGLHRLGFVSLCRELGSGKQVSPNFEKALSHFLSYQVTIDQWVSVTKEELGWSDDKLKDVENNPNPEVALHKLWNLLSDDDNFAFPGNMRNLCTDDLLSIRDLSMLLYRYINTDIATKNLSMAVQYKKQAVDFSLNDGREKIEKVLSTSGDGKRISIVATGGAPRVVITVLPDDKSSRGVGERFMNTRSSSDDIATLLQMIQSGGTEKFMPFYRAEISIDRGHP